MIRIKNLLVALLILALAACQPPMVASIPTSTSRSIPSPVVSAAPDQRTPQSTEPDPPDRITSLPTLPGSTAPSTHLPPTQTLTPSSPLGLETTDLNGEHILFWHPYTGAAGDVVSQLVQEYNRTNTWGVSVTALSLAGLDELNERLSTSLPAAAATATAPESGLPDLVVGTLPMALNWDTLHGLADLRRFADDPIWGYPAEAQADFYPSFWRQDVQEGRRVALPYLRTAQVLYYNTTWAGELGFSTSPATPQQFADQACASGQADGAGGLLVSPHYAAALSWIYSFGGEILRQPALADGENVYQFNTSQAEDAFTFLRQLYDSRCAWTTESQYNEAEFAGRRALFTTAGVMDLPAQQQVLQQTGNGDAWTVIGFPSPDQATRLGVYGTELVILSGELSRELAAWTLAQWLLEPRNHARLVEASSSFPLREAELAFLESYRGRSPQWAAALLLLPGAQAEPAYKSWGTVRWAVGDAFTQLFRSYFAIDQIPAMLTYLDRTASDLHLSPSEEDLIPQAPH